MTTYEWWEVNHYRDEFIDNLEVAPTGEGGAYIHAGRWDTSRFDWSAMFMTLSRAETVKLRDLLAECLNSKNPAPTE